MLPPREFAALRDILLLHLHIALICAIRARGALRGGARRRVATGVAATFAAYCLPRHAYYVDTYTIRAGSALRCYDDADAAC